MYKLVAAVTAVLVSGVIGAFTLQSSEAQMAPRVVESEPVKELYLEVVPEQRWQRDTQPLQFEVFRQQGQPGTWQIITNKEATILLNTASGETFFLAEREGNYAWKPIERPIPRAEVPAMPRLREMPRMPDMPAQPDRPNPDRPNADRLRKTLEEARKRLKEAEGDDRAALQRKVDELERTLRDLENNNKRDNPRNDVRDLEELLEVLTKKVSGLEKKIKDTDSKREAAELEGAANELRGEIKRVKKELEAARKEQK